METHPKISEKGGEIVDLQISPPEIPFKKKGKIEDLQMSSPEVQIEDLLESPPEIPLKKKGKIEDLQMSSPEVQIEDLSEEKLFLRKKTIQKSTKPVHQTKDQKLSLVKNLLQEICKNENEEKEQLQIQILLQIIKKMQKNQPIGKLQEKTKSDQDTNIQIALLQKQVTNIKTNMAKKINQVLEGISQKKRPH